MLTKAPEPTRAAALTRAQISAALKRARRRDREAKTTAVMAALRDEHLTQPPLIAAAYGVTVRVRGTNGRPCLWVIRCYVITRPRVGSASTTNSLSRPCLGETDSGRRSLPRGVPAATSWVKSRLATGCQRRDSAGSTLDN
jgi:hypothetical protein